jgi:Antitoxin ParD
MRLSIEIPAYQHQQIKAMAALRGISLKDYILEKTLSSSTTTTAEDAAEAEALAQLEALLAPRIAAAERGEFTTETIEEIIAEAHAQRTGS